MCMHRYNVMMTADWESQLSHTAHGLRAAGRSVGWEYSLSASAAAPPLPARWMTVVRCPVVGSSVI